MECVIGSAIDIYIPINPDGLAMQFSPFRHLQAGLNLTTNRVMYKLVSKLVLLNQAHARCVAQSPRNL